MTETYELVQQVLAHQDDVKGLCMLRSPSSTNENVITLVSGSRDRMCKMYKCSVDGKSFEETKIIFDHQHWVDALLALPNGGFATGCHDNTIHIYNGNGDLTFTVAGHNAPVISLSLDPVTGDLISGSWDGTAKVWTMTENSLTQKSILPDHENGVCVLGLPNGNIVTGSAGRNENGAIRGTKIRIWNNGAVIKECTEHTLSIRCLALLADGSGFVSCANDGTTKEWTLDGGLKQSMDSPLANDGTSAFIFSVAVAPKTGEILTANDDFCVRVWNNGDLVQQIGHPAEVWWVSVLQNGDIATGAGDGYIRIFTKNEDRKAELTLREIYFQETKKAIEEAVAEKAGGGGAAIDASKYPKIEEAMPGLTENELKVFNKNGVAWAYSWSAESQTWNEIGEAIGQAGGQQEIDGIKYDKVLDIELTDPAGAIRKLQIGFNNGDNPYTVAQEFIEKHSLGYEHVEDIANYITNNRGASGGPTIDMSGGGTAGAGGNNANRQTVSRQFPLSLLTGLSFEKVKLDKLLDKINEFNAEVAPPLKLNEQEVRNLESLIRLLEKTNFYHSSTFSSMQMSVVEKLLNWDDDHLFPVLDLVRVIFTHRLGASFLGEQRCKKIISQSLKQAAPGAQMKNILTAAWVFSNLFSKEAGAGYAVRMLMAEESIDVLVQPLSDLAEFDNKSVRLAVATILFNSANALYHTEQSSNDLLSVLAANALELCETCIKKSEVEAIRRCLCCFGTILLHDKDALESSQIATASELLESATTVQKDALAECIKQLKEVIAMNA